MGGGQIRGELAAYLLALLPLQKTALRNGTKKVSTRRLVVAQLHPRLRDSGARARLWFDTRSWIRAGGERKVKAAVRGRWDRQRDSDRCVEIRFKTKRKPMKTSIKRKQATRGRDCKDGIIHFISY